MDLGEVIWGGVDYASSEEGELESSCECGNEPSDSINCMETVEWLHNWWPFE
jgi:hypothetical protein